MKTVLSCALFIVITIFSAMPLSAQAKIKIIRTKDVDASSMHFITATKKFSLDIVLEGVANYSQVNFELRYNNAGAISYSGYESTNSSFLKSSIGVKASSNQISGTGSVLVNAQADIGANNNDPNIVRLIFVATQDGVNQSDISFSFNTPMATTENGGVRVISNLYGVSSRYNIHSFMDIWPGDTNGDGVVDQRDFTLIGLFYGNVGGTGASGLINGYQRDPASTIWSAQRALAWDSVRVTQVDCDGSGMIDMSDILVIFANYSKIHPPKAHQGGSDGSLLSSLPPLPSHKPIITANSVLIPVLINSPQRSVIGVSTRISFAKYMSKFKITDVQAGTMFSDTDGFLFRDKQHIADGYIDIAIGNTNKSEVKASGTLAFLVAEPLGADQTFTPDALNAKGIRVGGESFILTPATDVNEPMNVESRNFQMSVTPNPVSEIFNMLVNTNNNISAHVSVKIVNSLGINVMTIFENREISGTELNFPINSKNLPNGQYFVVLQSGNEQITQAFTVSK